MPINSPEVTLLRAYATAWVASIKANRERARHDERGEIAQTVIIVAVLAAAAIAITAIIVAKFTAKAKSIPTD